MPEIFTSEKNHQQTPALHQPAQTVETPLGNVPIDQIATTPEVSNFLKQHPETRLSMFATFGVNPNGVSFETQEKDETIVLFLRKHLITNVPWIVGSILLILIPPVLILLSSTGVFTLPFTFPSNFLFFFTFFYYLVVFAFVFVCFITWFYNISLVTNKRIVDIDYSDVVYRNVAVTKLEIIEDVSYIQTGVIRSVFNYGDVYAQTAAENENFDFLAVPQPQRVVTIIQDLIGRRKHG